MESTWNIPSLDDFMDSLIHEKKNLIQVGELKNPKPHALTSKGSSNNNKQKNKGKCNIPYIKSMQNRNKMLKMADEQQYNQNNTTIIPK
jgi:hypothetical protein